MRRILSIGLTVLLACGPGDGETVHSSAKVDKTSKAGDEPTATATADATASTSGASSADAPDALGSEVALSGSVSGDLAADPAPSTSASVVKADPSRLVLTGTPKQGGLVFAKVDGKVGRITFPGHRAVVSDDGEFPIAFYRNALAKEKMTIHFKDGSVLEHLFEVEQRTYEVDKIDGLPPNMVRLDPKTQKESNIAEAKVDLVRKKYGKKNCYKDGFKWPTIGKVTSRYGQPRILNGTNGGIHWGVDVAVRVGTPIKAPACGTVVFTDPAMPLAGGTLVLDHGHGLTSTFIHLSGFKKKVGDEVKQGEIIATSGKGGRTTGAHLHWAMNYFEIQVDPELLVEPMPGQKPPTPAPTTSAPAPPSKK